MIEKLYKANEGRLLIGLLNLVDFKNTSEELDNFIDSIIIGLDIEKKSEIKSEYDEKLVNYLNVIQRYMYVTGVMDGIVSLGFKSSARRLTVHHV